MNDKSSNAAGLPAEAVNFIEHIACKSSRRRRIRREVGRELTAHFEDALQSLAEAERAAAARELIEGFGDPALLAVLIGRGKRRCQPWRERALLATVKVAALVLVIGVVVNVVLSKLSGEALQREIARIRETGAPTNVQEVLEQARQNRDDKALNTEGHLKRCPATALLYKISLMHAAPETEVRGKRVFALDGPTNDYVTRLHDAWDADTAAAIGETLARNRDIIEGIHKLAALPPDDPSEVLWFQFDYWPENLKKLNLPHHGYINTEDGRQLAEPELLPFLDALSVMALDAVQAVQENRPDAALDDAAAIMALSDHLGKVSHTLIGVMVAVAMRGEATWSLVQPLLNRADVSEAAATRFLAAAARLDCAGAFAKALAWERMYFLYAYNSLRNGEDAFLATSKMGETALGRLRHTALNPYILRARLLPFLNNNDAMLVLGYLSQLVDTAALPYPEYMMRNGNLFGDLQKTAGWTSPIVRFEPQDFVPAKEDITASQVYDDLARTAFALRRFKLARGAYPDGIQALAPDFVAALPADQFTGKSLQYRKEGDGCVLYSVGHNDRDDGGKEGDFVWKLTR